MYQINIQELDNLFAKRFPANLSLTFAEVAGYALMKTGAWARIRPEEASLALERYWLEGIHVYDTPMGKYKSKQLRDGSIMFFKWCTSDKGLPVRGWPSRILFYIRKNYPVSYEDGKYIIDTISKMVERDFFESQQLTPAPKRIEDTSSNNYVVIPNRHYQQYQTV